MKTRQFLKTLAVIISFASFTRQGFCEEQKPQPAIGKIILGSTGGKTGKGNGRSLTIESDGKFTASNKGKALTGNLTKEEQEKLKTMVTAVSWKDVKKAYKRPHAYDILSDTILVMLDGNTEFTSIDQPILSPEGVPQEVTALLDYLKSLHARYANCDAAARW